MSRRLTEHDLDRLLAATAASPRTEAQVAARDMATLTRSATDVAQRPPRRRRRIAAIAAAAVLLSGAGTLTAYEMSIPPFVSLPDGLSRVRPPIVAEYDGVDGLRHRCQVFPEFENLTREQDEAARAWASAQDWTGYGDRLETELDATSREREEHQLFDAVGDDLRSRFAEQMVPGVELNGLEAVEPGRAGLAGFTGICRVVPDAQ